MTKEKDATVDQIFALSMRIAKALRKQLDQFDGDLVQEAITKKDHPFWLRLKALSSDVFTIPFEFREIGEARRITVNDGRRPVMILNALGDWGRNVTRDSVRILASVGERPNSVPEEVDIVFLYPTHRVPEGLILEEFKRRKWENVAPEDALRLIERDPKMYYVNDGRHSHNIAFINEGDPSKTLELGYDGMGCPFLDTSSHVSLCYAARRKVGN